MIAYHTPGVYFEYRDISPLVVGLPRSDITGFAGIAMRGPVFEPVKVESWVQFVSTYGDFIPQGYLAYAVYGFFANGGRTCWVSRVIDQATAQKARLDIGNVEITAGTEGSWANHIYVRPTVSGTELAALSIRFPDGQEQFLRPPFIAASTARDNLFDLPQSEIDPKQTSTPLLSFRERLPVAPIKEGFLQEGVDGLSQLKPEQFAKAFENLGAVGEIGIIAAPDLMPKRHVLPEFQPAPTDCCRDNTPVFSGDDSTIEFPPAFNDLEIQELQKSMTASAEGLHYRFAILDGPGDRVPPPGAISWRDALPSSSFSAIYYPWILVDDPLRLQGLVRAIPPSGHVAGAFARSDERKGVHKPPMNEVLEAVSDVAFPVDDDQHGLLNDDNINAIRIMPGRGVRVMGARTLWRENILFRYVNVRRLLSAIEKALEQSLNWTVFEPNNRYLWSEVDRTVRGLLEDLFRRGMLDGGTSEEAYSVQCDRATNPPAETELGRVICEVGIRPPYPAEFVVVTLGISKDGIQIREASEHSA